MSSLTFTLVQADLAWEDKQTNLSALGEKITRLQEKTEIIVLPEMFNTGFSMQPEKFAETMDGPTIRWMKETAATKRVIVTGSLMITEHDCYYNRLVWMLPTGEYGYYDKRHLFAYGQEDGHYSRGSKRLIASVKGWKINLQVCYDLRFPVWARQASEPGQPKTEPEYDVLVYVANWPERRIHAWKTLLTARAIENQSYVVGVNRVGNDGNGIYHSGDSMVIDALGQVLYHKANEEDTATVTLQKDALTAVRNKFPFWKDSDNFMIINTSDE